MSTKPIDYDALAAQGGGEAVIDYDALAAQHGGTAQSAAQPSTWQVLTQPTDKTDAEYKSYRGPAGVAGATIKGLDDVARGTQGAIAGIYNTVRHPIDTAKSIASLPAQAAQVPSAISAINATPDAGYRYADVAQDTVSQAAGQALTALGTAGIAKVAPEAAGAIRDLTPSAMRTAAGQLFQKVTAKAGDFPVDVEGPGQAALRIKELADRGGSLPMVVRKFLNRVTAPDANPMTYSEARDFYSNATRLSVDETNRLTPKLKFEVGNFTRQLGQSIQQSANAAGVGAEHAQAMFNYARAMNYADKLEAIKGVAAKQIGNAAKAGAASAVGYETYKALRD